MAHIFIDLSEFLTSPLRTGIQRVVGEVCRNWPAEVDATIVKIGLDGQLVVVDSKVLPAIVDYFASASGRGAADRIRSLADHADQSGERVHLEEGDRLLVPEVFYEDKRLTFYENLLCDRAKQAFFIVFDLLPLTHPELFPPIRGDHVARYFRLIQRAENLGFISGHTRFECCNRLRRDRLRIGPILRLGSDSLVSRGTGQYRGKQPLFVVLGTIEPRKNHTLILDALQDEMMADDCPFRLAFVGQSGWAPPDLVKRIRVLNQNSKNFTYLEGLGDDEVGRTISDSWATIAVSSAEGFGLPAVESLWLGVPVISTNSMPSLESIELGVERIAELSVTALRFAVQRILDPVYHETKAAEARHAALQTWADFGRQTCRWISEERGHGLTANAQSQFRSRISDPVMISSAQNLEDVMLARAFKHKTQGFYIDVGAMDPFAGSVTRYFYDLGWRGINIEPDPRFFSKLVEARPGDINLSVALSSSRGRKELYVLENIGMSTIIEERTEGYRLLERCAIEVRTLADICEEVSPAEIDFLKVDVEGAEADVLRGGDWLRFRPKILIVESTAPFSYEPTWQEWHPLLTLAGYQMVYEDGINRFYCREESAELAEAFQLPPNVLDHYTTAEVINERQARLDVEGEVTQLRKEVLQLRRRCSELEEGVTSKEEQSGG